MPDFSASLIAARGSDRVPVIPDIKLVSPKQGRLIAEADAARCAEMMAAAGAPAISVVTEPSDFGGSTGLLREIVSAVPVPVLRKDFIKTTDDIDQSLALGASAVLLICAIVAPDELAMLYHHAQAVGIEPFVECRSQEELELASSLGATLVGINNREINNLELDDGTVERTARLASLKPDGAVLVSESGILSPADVRAAIDHGADAVLVGTAIWQADDPAAFYRELARA